MKRLLLLILCSSPGLVFAAGFGNISSNNIDDSATICMQVGIQAELTGLEDFSLQTTSANGSAGATYSGQDQFHLTSNAPIRLLIEATPLSQGEHNISTDVAVDGVTKFYDTDKEVIHDAIHTLTVDARLGAISSQLSGSYQSTVMITVAPQMGDAYGCGEVTLTLPGTAEKNYAVVAFEDLYPSAGDADYNDFVVRYSVEENYNAAGELESINMTYTPIARGAG